MGSQQYRGELERKRKQRVDAEKKAGEYRNKESKKRAEADKARQEATKTKSAATQKSKLSRAAQRDTEAASAGSEANKWQAKASGYRKQEADLQTKLARAERSEADAAERKRKREQTAADRRAAAERAATEARFDRTEHAVGEALRELRAPKPEKLRVLLLGASSEGDLRVGREQKRIRSAVESALHRDLIELDVRPAATASDLLDGITKFRPHVVHFSGHSNEDLIVFEHDTDAPHAGHVVTARARSPAPSPPLTTRPCSCCSTPANLPRRSINSSRTPSRSLSAWPTASTTETPSTTPPSSTPPSRTDSPCARRICPDRPRWRWPASTVPSSRPSPQLPTSTPVPRSWSSPPTDHISDAAGDGQGGGGERGGLLPNQAPGFA